MATGNVKHLYNLPFVHCKFCDEVIAYAPEYLVVAFTNLTDYYINTKGLFIAKPSRNACSLRWICRNSYSYSEQQSAIALETCRKITDFLDSLAEPVITGTVKESLLTACKVRHKTGSVKEFTQMLGILCQGLPSLNLETLIFLLKSFNLVTRFARTNRVTAKRLAREMAPHLFGKEECGSGLRAALKLRRLERRRALILTLLIQHPEVVYPLVHGDSFTAAETTQPNLIPPLEPPPILDGGTESEQFRSSMSTDDPERMSSTTSKSRSFSCSESSLAYFESIKGYCFPTTRGLRRNPSQDCLFTSESRGSEETCESESSISTGDLTGTDFGKTDESQYPARSQQGEIGVSDFPSVPSVTTQKTSLQGQSLSEVVDVLPQPPPIPTTGAIGEEEPEPNTRSVSLGSMDESELTENVASVEQGISEDNPATGTTSPLKWFSLETNVPSECGGLETYGTGKRSVSFETGDETYDLEREIPDFHTIRIGWVKKMITWFEMIIKSNCR